MAWTLRYSLPKVLLAAVAVLSVALIFTASSALHQRIVDVPIYVPVNHTVYVNKTIYLNRTVYVRVPLYINHTIYLNRTIYVEKPIYINHTIVINRTVYVQPPTRFSNSSVSSIFDGVACSMESLVLPNGTMWTVGAALVTPKIYSDWIYLILSRLDANSGSFNETNGVLYGDERGFEIYPSMGMGGEIYGGVPFRRPGNWSDYWIFGDTVGLGDLTGLTYNFTLGGVQHSYLLLPTNRGFSMVPDYIPFPLNSSKTVLLITGGELNVFGTWAAFPCNWTVIGPVNPQAALSMNITMPIFKLTDEEMNYIIDGYFNAKHLSWGYWTWNIGFDQ